MSGFAQQNEGWDRGALPNGADPTLASGNRAMFYYDQTDVPFYYDLAKDFAIADHYHASVLGPTDVNRMYFWAGTSFGETANVFPDISGYPFPPVGADGGYANVEAAIVDELEERHTNWAFFGDDFPSAAVVYGISLIHRWRPVVPKYRLDPDPANPSDKTDFIDQAMAGTLPRDVVPRPRSLAREHSDGNDNHAARRHPDRREARERCGPRGDGEPAVAPHRALHHVGRARRVL